MSGTSRIAQADGFAGRALELDRRLTAPPPESSRKGGTSTLLGRWLASLDRPQPYLDPQPFSGRMLTCPTDLWSYQVVLASQRR